MSDDLCSCGEPKKKDGRAQAAHERLSSKHIAKASPAPEPSSSAGPAPAASDLTALMYQELKELREQVAQLKARDQEMARTATIGDPLDIPEMQGIMKIPVTERAERLIQILQNLTPEQRAKRQEAILSAYAALPPAPEGTDELRPGTYVLAGKDAKGEPTFNKVKYTKEWLESHYPMVTLNVLVDTRGPIQFGEVKYDVKLGQSYQVPSIIKELYDQYVFNLKLIEWRYQPLTKDEDWNITQQAALTGKPVWSRVYRAGLGILPPEVIGISAPAPDAQA